MSNFKLQRSVGLCILLFSPSRTKLHLIFNYPLLKSTYRKSYHYTEEKPELCEYTLGRWLFVSPR